MPENNNPYSFLNDPNSIWGPNFLQKVGSAVSSVASSFPSQPVVAGVRVPTSPTSTPSALGGAFENFRTGGLIRTSRFNRPTQPQYSIATPPNPPPMAGGGAPSFSRSIPVSQVLQPQTQATQEAVRLGGFMGLSPQSRNVVSAVVQPLPTGIAGGTMGGLPAQSIDERVASARFGAIPTTTPPIAPVTMGISGATPRQGVRTAYGMIYPAAGQEAAAQRIAAMGPMGARLANVRQELNQQERIAQMRERGAQLAKQNISAQEAFFAQKRAERASGIVSANQPSTIRGIQQQFQQFRNLGNRTPSVYAQERGIGGSVYSQTPFALARGREAIGGLPMTPQLSNRFLASVGGGPQPSQTLG